jgi:hypothetical protein
MRWLLLAALAAAGQGQASSGPLDVSTLKISAPTAVAELDMGKLKGEPRQLAWSPDFTQFYIQTADGDRPDDTVHHYTIAATGGAVIDAPRAPEWAVDYWRFKQDRYAPGIPDLIIDLTKRLETVKVGTGSAGAADGGDRAGGGTVMSGANIDREAQNTKQNVWRLTLLDQAISVSVNKMPIPGLTFTWGPPNSGAIVFTDPDGRLVFFDQKKHKQTVSGVKEAVLPAWTTDGSRIAFLQKSGRKKYTLMTATVGPH